MPEHQAKITVANKFPDFLIIGAGKSGTTSLNNYLSSHPGIFMSAVKEPNFFGYELANEEDYDDEETKLHYQNSITDVEAYLSLFEGAKPDQIKGETSNTYLYHERALERILHYIPDVKLVAILRQPAERLYSRYLHLARENELPTEDFQDCLNRDTIWWKRGDLVTEGFYYRNLSKYFQSFPADQINVFLYEDFKSDPVRVIQSICSFISVDDSYIPDTNINYNQSGFVKSQLHNRIFGNKGIIQNSIKRIVPGRFYQSLKGNSFLQKRVNRIRSSNLKRPKLDNNLKQKITNDIYKEDIKSLSKLINRDLSHWY